MYLKALGKRVTGPWQWWIGDRAGLRAGRYDSRSHGNVKVGRSV